MILLLVLGQRTPLGRRDSSALAAGLRLVAYAPGVWRVFVAPTEAFTILSAVSSPCKYMSVGVAWCP